MSGAYPRRYDSLDAWRGVAALLVLLWHRYWNRADWASPLWLGVQLFFVISGYCIACAGDRAMERGGGAGEFMRRRVRRIGPPYLASVGFALAAHAWLGAVHGGRAGAARALTLKPVIWIENLTLTQWLASTRFWIGSGLRSGFRVPWDNGHYLAGVHWSLNYEEQFYLLTAGMVLLASRRIARPGPLLAALTAGSLLLNLARPGLVTGLFWDYWAQFACGVALFYRLCKLEGARARRIFDSAFLAAFVAVAAVALLHGDLPPTPFRVHTFGLLLVCVAFAGLLLIARRFDSRIAASAPARSLAVVGQFSYSLYLIHQEALHALAPIEAGLPLPAAALDVLVLGAVIGGAYLFHRVFEKPFLNPETRPSLQPQLAAY
jgi:peptidoglycan/LPS O-acetylase OafA/YrhL